MFIIAILKIDVGNWHLAFTFSIINIIDYQLTNNVLYLTGQKDKENCAKVPKTCELIDKIIPARTCSRGQVWFILIYRVGDRYGLS